MPTEKRVIEFSRSDFQALADGEEIRLDVNGSGAWVRADPEIATEVRDGDDDSAESDAETGDSRFEKFEPGDVGGDDPEIPELKEGTVYHETALAVANSPKKWVRPQDISDTIDASGLKSSAESLASTRLSELHAKGALRRERVNGRGYRYRLKEWYRREFSQYDSLNGGRE